VNIALAHARHRFRLPGAHLGRGTDALTSMGRDPPTTIPFEKFLAPVNPEARRIFPKQTKHPSHRASSRSRGAALGGLKGGQIRWRAKRGDAFGLAVVLVNSGRNAVRVMGACGQWRRSWHYFVRGERERSSEFHSPLIAFLRVVRRIFGKPRQKVGGHHRRGDLAGAGDGGFFPAGGRTPHFSGEGRFQFV